MPLFGTFFAMECAMRKLRSASLTSTSIDKHGAKAKAKDGSEKCCGEDGSG